MMGKRGIFLNVFLVLMFISSFTSVSAQIKRDKAQKISGFTENKGQFYDQDNRSNSDVRYLFSGLQGLNIQLKNNGFSYDAYSVDKKVQKVSNPKDKSMSKSVDELIYQYHRIDVELVGANPAPQIVTEDAIEGFANYYTHNSSEKGILKVNSFQKVTYLDIYPEIDLEFKVSQNRDKPFEYNFIVRPGGDLSQIKLRYIGSDGLEIAENKLKIKTRSGVLSETIPTSWIKETGEGCEILHGGSRGR